MEEGDIKLNPNEHIDFCWATEAQVRDSSPYDDKKSQQEGLVMLESKKQSILDAFERLKNSYLDIIVRAEDTRR
ncbi:hypothetical protein NUU61_001555 [Penicillium alfredii]|uniref:Uncharacterized protein n=1 Tax=Penicillium alfredii TaxID=1506179 RepID=A0A9W9G4B8_9EURO|nr:uncharacterized protein NUU61_001555 [Penicillium alfredii]KAJ5111925.1 hypothetical protein NUU61_001555 [Penicillium alfredii]